MVWYQQERQHIVEQIDIWILKSCSKMKLESHQQRILQFQPIKVKSQDSWRVLSIGEDIAEGNGWSYLADADYGKEGISNVFCWEDLAVLHEAY